MRKNFIKVFFHCLLAIGLSGYASVAGAWDFDYVLPPVNQTVYTAVTPGSSTHFLSDSYSSQAFNMPVSPVKRGSSLRIQVVAPPGTSSISVRGESNQWQGSGEGTYPIMAVFDHDPGEFCQAKSTASTSNNGTACNQVSGNYVYLDGLTQASGGLNASMYGNGSPTFTPLTQARYVTFALYDPVGAFEDFRFESLQFTFLIINTDAYTTWRNARPWAGGPLTNSVYGIGSTDNLPDSGGTVPASEVITLGELPNQNPAVNISFEGSYRQHFAAPATTLTQGAVLPQGVFLELKTKIIPDPTHSLIKAVIVALWEDDSGAMLWKQKQSPNFFDTSPSWTAWDGPATLGSLTVYQEQLNAEQAGGYTVEIGKGFFAAPGELTGKQRKVTFFAGYTSVNQLLGNDFYIVNKPGYTLLLAD